MVITANSKIITKEQTLLQELEGEAVLLNLDNNQYYRLNEDSLRMFTVMTTSANLDDAMKILLAEYNISTDELWNDLQTFVEDLEKSGLVRLIDG